MNSNPLNWIYLRHWLRDIILEIVLSTHDEFHVNELWRVPSVFFKIFLFWFFLGGAMNFIWNVFFKLISVFPFLQWQLNFTFIIFELLHWSAKMLKVWINTFACPMILNLLAVSPHTEGNYQQNIIIFYFIVTLKVLKRTENENIFITKLFYSSLQTHSATANHPTQM